MSKVQEIRTSAFTKSGRKRYRKHFVIIPKMVMKVLRLDKGDDVTFEFDREDLISGFVRLRKREYS
jgi:bifunctional DNA-binding transcriptional regulator/antitoxin component of YhaV-PrlF toxin-antitoxin module